ncbi:MAG: HEAT repeat domain-containing protein, partial [Thermodesulfobacteriota bacterium]
GEIRDARAVEPLIVALKNEDSEVRGDAAWALRQIICTLNDYPLAEIKDARIIEALIATLKDENREVPIYTEEILEKITRKDFGQDPVKWQEWWEQNRKNFLKEKQ